jgi:hypothetical protein
MAFLPTVTNELRRLKKLAERAMAQVPDQDLHWRPDKESNSIAIILRHLGGNMASRWTDFLKSDGEKPERHRDTEFEDDMASRDELMKMWEHGWVCLFQTLEGLTESDLEKTVYIRAEPQTVIQAISRQMWHYGYHIGQIVYVAKHLRSEEWRSLSIPRGKSAEYLRRGLHN